MKKYLEDIASNYSLEHDNSNYAIIANMHALPSVAELFDVLIQQGFMGDNILFFGKPYSTIESAKKSLSSLNIIFESLSNKFLAGTLIEEHKTLLENAIIPFIANHKNKHFILLDSGGYLASLFNNLYPKLDKTNIQLTSSGSRFFEKNDKNLIDIGSCNVKKDFESFEIAKFIFKEILNDVPQISKKNICLIGKGSIGLSLSKVLKENDVAFDHYDGREHSLDVNQKYNVVIGSTGFDISALVKAIVYENEMSQLFSCSSWDIEFKNIILQSQQIVDLDDKQKAVINYKQMKIYNAGCPINFNRKTATEDKGIAVTRGLTLAAILNKSLNDQDKEIVLSTYNQHFNN